MEQLPDRVRLFLETANETHEDEPTFAQLDPQIPASQWVYIVRGYSEDQRTKNNDIQERDVVRPSNHRWCKRGGAETEAWKQKSTQRCPTYGSCGLCFRSGPVGKVCIKHKDWKYKVIIHPLYSNTDQKIFDSQTLAEIMGT